MTTAEALKVYYAEGRFRIRAAWKLREAARTLMAAGRTADYPKVLDLFNRAEAIEAHGVTTRHEGQAL